MPTATIAAVLTIRTTNRTLITTDTQDIRLRYTVCDRLHSRQKFSSSACTFPPLPLPPLRPCAAGEAVRSTRFPLRIDLVDILDANPDLFLRNVDSRLDGEHHSRTELCLGVADVVNFQTDIVPQAVDEVLPERLPMQVFAVRVDVVVGDLVERIWCLSVSTGPT